MKKTFAFLLALCMIFALAVPAYADGKTTLTMATSPDFPPFEELQADGSVVGIEVDLLNLICEKLGLELVIEQMDFDSVLPGVQAGKYDVGVSGISVTEKRQKNVLFTEPYCLAAQAIVVKTGSEITGKADLDKKKIAVQTGTTAESFCMENGYKVSSFQANSDAEMALVTGKVDAWVIDEPSPTPSPLPSETRSSWRRSTPRRRSFSRTAPSPPSLRSSTRPTPRRAPPNNRAFA